MKLFINLKKLSLSFLCFIILSIGNLNSALAVGSFVSSIEMNRTFVKLPISLKSSIDYPKSVYLTTKSHTTHSNKLKNSLTSLSNKNEVRYWLPWVSASDSELTNIEKGKYFLTYWFFSNINKVSMSDELKLGITSIFVNKLETRTIFINSPLMNQKNNELLINNYTKKFIPYHMTDKTTLGFYLAGLIEGDGSFHKNDLRIAFNLNDRISAKNLVFLFGGSTYITKHQNQLKCDYVVTGEKVKPILELVNGKFVGTAKLNQIKNAQSAKKLSVTMLPAVGKITNDNWLSGFFEADGSFTVFRNRLKNGNNGTPNFRITFSQQDKFLLEKICEYTPTINWHLYRQTKGKNEWYNLTVQKVENVREVLKIFNNTNFYSTKFNQLKIFNNAISYKTSINSHKYTLEERNDLNVLADELLFLRHNPQSNDYRYNFTFNPGRVKTHGERTRSTLSYQQMLFLNDKKKKKWSIQKMAATLELSSYYYIRGIDASSLPYPSPSRYAISRYFNNVDKYLTEAKEVEKNQKLALINYIKERKKAKKTAKEIRQELGNANYSLAYYKIKL